MTASLSLGLIGRIEKGFDFLGYHFSPPGLTGNV